MNDEEYLKKCGIYIPELTRESAEEQLKMKKNGSFFLRNSKTPGCIAISYKTKENSILHSLILKESNGYKIPEGKTIYLSLFSLLVTLPFLDFNPPKKTHASETSIQMLSEMFPNMNRERIETALIEKENDPNAALDLLLSQGSQLVNLDFPSTTTQKSLVKPYSENEDPLATAFIDLLERDKSSFRMQVFDGWTKISRVLKLTPSNMEQNLTKILGNPEHNMGKKLQLFIQSYKITYSTMSISQFDLAISELVAFITSLQSTICAKVPDLKSPSSVPMVWKVIETLLLPEIYEIVFNLFERQYPMTQDFAALKNATFQDLNIPIYFQLTNAPSPYLKSITNLQSLPSIKTVHGKIFLLIEACLAIQEDIKAYYTKELIPPNGKISVNSRDLLPILQYIICQAQVSSLMNEIRFIRALTDASVFIGLEGFAVASFECALSRINIPPKSKHIGNLDAVVNIGQRFTPSISNSNPPTNKTLLSQFLTPPSQDNSNNSPVSHKHYQAIVQKEPTSEEKLQSDEEEKPLTTNRPNKKESSNTSTDFLTLSKIEKQYVQTLKQSEKTPQIHNELATYYNNKGKIAKALYHWNEALLLDPTNAIAKSCIQTYHKNPRQTNQTQFI